MIPEDIKEGGQTVDFADVAENEEYEPTVTASSLVTSYFSSEKTFGLKKPSPKKM